MEAQTTTETPATRREIWLSIALAVAQDGLPEPQELNLHSDLVCLYLDTPSDGRAWARWLHPDTHALHNFDDCLSETKWEDEHGTNYTWHVQRGAWSWNITVHATRDETKDLAAQVAAAILTPDALTS